MQNSLERYIDSRLNNARWKSRIQRKYGVIVEFATGDDAVASFCDNVFTNEVRTFFAPSFVATQTCACGARATDRCHGISRPVLARLALDRVCCGTRVQMSDWITQFFQEHKDTDFSFKCRACHKQETVHSKKTGAVKRSPSPVQ